jgi:hypothetical protein
MSQITDEIQAGRRCASGCGTTIVPAHGYPVVCDACWAIDPEWCQAQGLRRAQE